MIQIDEMVIRVPGMGPEDARWIGEEVASQIAGRLPDQVENKKIDELNVKLSFSPGLGRAEIANRIADQLFRQLKLR